MAKITQLKALRLRQGIAQVDFAKKLGLAVGVIQQYEANKRTPNVYTAQRLVNALGVTVDKLFPLPAE